MPETVYEIFRRAIQRRQVLELDYEGHRRVVCPYVLGLKQGQPKALCYQVGGMSSRGPILDDNSPEHWRCLELHKVTNVQARTGPWRRPTNYNAATQHCVDNVDIAIGE